MLASTKLHLEQLESRNLPAPIAYHGGPVLQHVKVEALFGGIAWAQRDMAREQTLTRAIGSLIGGNYMDKLSQLSGIGRGSLDKVDVLPTVNPPGPITNIVGKIKGEIAAGRLPLPDAETCYLFIGAKNHSVQGGEVHGSFKYGGQIAYYAVVPFDNHDIPTSFQSETWGITYDIVNAATDPAGNGWYFNNGDELAYRGDALNNGNFVNFKTPTGTYAVSPYWLALPKPGADAYFASLVTAPRKHETLGDFAELAND